MTAVGAAAKTMDFRRGCGSGDGPSFQGSSDMPSRRVEWTQILVDSGSRAAATIVFGGPDLALEPANRVRRSHCSAPSDRFVPRPRSSFIQTVDRRVRVRRGPFSYPCIEVGERPMIWRRRRPVLAPVATSSGRHGRRSCCERPSSRRTSWRACGAVGRRRSASDGHGCAALVSA